ncbi:cyclic peptide export ABC transporter [Catenovulum sediminis]|uniref:cyclic peptide export ABC transporter n=1 Tax=Catenovulum sediminis TaxID=1740262 RepID=UPI00117DD8C1|nr:cyclic peptide export ABC transporter [Catenovulum sediminis]
MELKKISDLYWANTPNLFFSSLTLGMFTGLCYATLVPFIMYATSAQQIDPVSLEISNFSFFDSPTASMAKAFLYTCLAIILLKSISHILSVYIVHKSTVLHRIELYKRINALSYSALERIGQARLINIINVDIHNIYSAATSLPFIWISLITVMGTLSYLLYLNERVFVFVLFAILIAIVIYQIPSILGVRYFSRSRASFDKVQDGAKGLIYGAKELKLSRHKSQNYLNENLIKPEFDALQDNFKGMAIVTFAEVYGELIAFLVIGIVIFHLTYMYAIDQTELFGIVVALLYLTGPVSIILGSLGEIQKGKVSLKRIQAFYAEMHEEKNADVQQTVMPPQIMLLKNLSYQYADATADNSFALKDINLKFKQGEVTFIVGGNGSGKSTLSKLLTLHYHATAGQILYDGVELNSSNLQSYREHISAIYTDFYLFEKLYGEIDEEKSARLLSYLELQEKVVIKDNQFSTLNLSDGQRKRLALFAALYENRQICLFDEWAADQDPRFKDIFYRTILPSLKAQGKIIIAITHDDRYFDYADQLVLMENGRVREVKYRKIKSCAAESTRPN